MRTLVDMLRRQAERDGPGRAFTYLEDGLVEGPSLTFAALDRRARAIAAELQAAGAAGERALLLFPAGLEFLAGLFGCLYAGVIGIPAPPPEASRAKRTWPRLRAIIEDAQVAWVVATSDVRAAAEAPGSGLAAFGDLPLRWLATDRVDPARAEGWCELAADPARPAYLQYTSGSTSAARGVIVTHRNLIVHTSELRAACGYGPDSVTVTWMPNFHDYGLVEGLIVPLANGTPCYVMSPFAFVKRPSAWLRALSRYRGTHSQGPNFAYDHCARRIGAAEREGLDLSGWAVAGIGAEPINPRVMESFYRAFRGYGFRWEAFSPAYGLAEATLQVSSTPPGEPPAVGRFRAEALEAGRVEPAGEGEPAARAVVGCGRPFGSVRMAIVHPETRRRCGPDEVGEVWVSGPAVADGYWRHPDETEQTFRAVTADGDGPSLRTGDLGFLDGGQLFITGRLKDLIIIRGANHYPQDIEWTVQQAHPALRPENGAAFSVIVDGEERLVIAQEVERSLTPGPDADAVVEAIRQAISGGHELDVGAVVLVARGSLPKTASGKIQRRAARAAYLAGGLNEVVRWAAPARPGAGGVGAGPGDNGERPPPRPDGESRRRADDLIGWLRSYAAERVNSRLIDERRCIPPYIILDFGNRGLLGLQVPESYGGLGLGYRDALRVVEQLAAIDLTLATVVLLNNTNGIRPIQHFARPGLRDELLPVLARGRELAAFALSEPGAGSNLAGLRGEARPGPAGGWQLRAVKRWNAASWAGVVSVFVRAIGPDGRLGGLTGFAIRQGAPGLRVGPEALTMGLRGSVQNALYLRDVPAGPEQVLGEVGRGTAVVDDALTAGRLYIAAACLGAMRRCAQLMHRYAARRPVATGRLLDNPVTRVKLGGLTARIAATEALVYRAADDLDGGHEPSAEVAAAAKVVASEFAALASHDLMQVLGGRGYMENNLAPQILRDARAMSIGEGPNEVLHAYLGRSACQTDAVARLLAGRWGAEDLARRLGEGARETVGRCQSPGSPFTDRPAALAWAHALVGRATTDALLLAATRGPSSRAGRAGIDWAAARFEAALDAARRGAPEEPLALTAGEASGVVVGYAEAIGDVEQGLPGEEDALEPALRLGPDGGGPPGGLPGAEQPPPDRAGGLTPQAKRVLLGRLLRHEAGPAPTPEP